MKRHALASLAALLFSAFASVASAQSAAPQRVVDGFSGMILICNPAVAQAWGIPICEVTAQEFTARAKAGNMRHLVGKPGAVDSMPEHATPKGPIETAKSLRLLIWFDRLDRPEKGWQMNLRAYSELRGPGGQRMWRNDFRSERDLRGRARGKAGPGGHAARDPGLHGSHVKAAIMSLAMLFQDPAMPASKVQL